MNDLLMELLKAIVIAIVPILATYGVKALNSWRLTNEIVLNNSYLDDIIDIIVTTVAYTSQTYVDFLKNQGSFNKESQIEAFNKTRDKVLELLSEEMKKFIVDKYGNLDLWLETKIEQIVKETK